MTTSAPRSVYDKKEKGMAEEIPLADRDLLDEPVERIDDDVASLEAWAKSLNEDVLDVDTCTFEQAAAYLHRIREVVRSLRDSEAAFEEWMAAVWKDQQWQGSRTVPGIGDVEVKRGQERKQWDHSGLGKAVVEALIESRGGEVPSPWEVRDALMEAAGIGYWKVKALKSLGIDPGDYCQQTPGTRRVIIT